MIETEHFVAVGFSIPVAEVLATNHESRNRSLQRLGDDLLSDQFDLNEAVERLRRMASSRLDDALLDQSVMAGVGNVYKSEVLFLAGLSPARKVGELDDTDLERLVRLSRDLLRRNVAADASRPGTRRTTRSMNPKERLWVYGRATRPCRQCGTPLRRELTGRDVRVTYWCPSCQPD